jgi:Bacterial Ig-like domain (group 2)/Chitobiase/beta-hexosaminidase C-terminal domain
MHKLITFLLLSGTVPMYASTYTILAGSSADAIQNVVNSASASPGNTVMFSAGNYQLDYTIGLPCSNGTVYTGPNVGVVTQNHLPTAVLSSFDPTDYAFATFSNGASLTGARGCTVQYLRFTGTQGGVLVYYPASGITIQNNAFDHNNPPVGGDSSQSAIYLTGNNSSFTPNDGVTHITIVWNVFFSNCADINAASTTDSGGSCASTWVNGYNNYLTWSNNTINLTEEGLKLSQQQTAGIGNLNTDVENNNMQGNQRILIEAQQETNGVGIFSHNAFYQPVNPDFNTFELSLPEWLGSISPTHTIDDNVFIGNVPINVGGSGAHYGIGLELWGPGSIATNNLFQGGNGPSDCDAGWSCSGWVISVGEPFTNATITGNYFSGTDAWAGSSTDVSYAISYEDGGSPANAGIVLQPNTVVQTSTTIPTIAPKISVSGSTVTITSADPVHTVSVFYTTDGSTPAIFGPGGKAGTTKVYTAPFAAPAATVRAIASWGQGANQGIVFPSFGYVPSKIVTATVGGSSGAATTGTSSLVPPASSGGGISLVSAYLGAPGNANSLVSGHGMQFSAYGIYSDGSIKALPNPLTPGAIGWATTNKTVAKVNLTGRVTGMSSGTVNVKAIVGGLTSSTWRLTVTAPPAAKDQASIANAQEQPTMTANTETTSMSANAQPSAGAESRSDAAEPEAGPMPPASSAGGGGSGGTRLPLSGPVTPVPSPVTGALTAGMAPEAPSAPLSDTFQGPFWETVSPAGGTASISKSHLFLGVPGGSNHDVTPTMNQALRVVQSIGNDDFDVAIRIDSPLYASDANTSQGLMALAGENDYLTFGLTTDGSKIGLSARTVMAGAATTVLADGDFTEYQNPMYLRLAKSGSSYAAYYSADGTNWKQATTFTYSKASTQIGPFAANSSSTPANAVPVVMSVSWFDVLQ